MKLRAKFLFSLVLVVMAVISPTLLVMRRTLQRQVRSAFANDLRSAAHTFAILQQDRRELLTRSAQLVADEPRLRAMMTSNDPETVQDASKDLVSATRSEIFVVYDREGRVMAFHAIKSPANPEEVGEWARRIQFDGDQDQWRLIAGNLYEIFTQPIYFGSPGSTHLLGFVTVGYQVSDSMVRQVANSSESEVVFLFGDTVAATTVTEFNLSKCERCVAQMSRSDKTGSPYELMLGNQRHLAMSVRLNDDPVPVRLVVLKSFAKADRVLADLNWILLLVGVCATGVGFLMMFGISKRFGRPLAELLAGVRALSEGDSDFPLNVRTKDEFGELTEAFESMRGSLVSARKKLLQTEQLATIGRTAGSLSHDMRHHLNAISGNAEFLIKEENPARREMFYQGIWAAINQTTELLDALVEFSKGADSLKRRFLDLGELLQVLALEVRLYPQFQGIRITVHCPEPVEGWFDGKRLRRAFFNLLFNACEVVSNETGAIEIDIRQAYMKTEVRVTDNGPGVPEEIRRSLFEPFVTSGKIKGTGLGLAIVLKCCRDHGGDVELEESIPGRTTFKVVLPLSNFEDSEDQTGSAMSGAVTDSRSIRRDNVTTTHALIRSILSGIPLFPFFTWRRG